MVGVPGRSRACDNCRRRRIKCDLGEPACQRCLKSKLTCGGNRGVMFVHHDGRKYGVQSGQSLPTNTTFASSANTLAARPQLLGFSIFKPQNDLLLEYYRARLLQGPDAEDIVTVGIDRSLSDASELALATTFFGAEHRDRNLFQWGLRRYGRVLTQLNKALSDPVRCRSFDLLEAVVNLSFFEYVISQGNQGWIRHARGFEKLVAIRGPHAFTAHAELKIFERTRTSIIFAALLLRQPTILSNVEWKVIPWSLFPERKAPLQKLIDILVDCPTLLANKGTFESRYLDDTTQEAFDMEEATQVLLKKLHCFEADWQSTHSVIAWEVPAPETTPLIVHANGSLIPTWTTVLHYHSLVDANIIMMSGAIRIFLLALQRHGPNESKAADSAITSAIVICRSMDYQLEEIRKGASSHLLIWPLKMALEALDHDDKADIRTWLVGILDTLSGGATRQWCMQGGAPES